MASTVSPARAARMVTASLRKDSASVSISFGIVAEKNTVWQVEGSVSKMRLIAG